MRVKAGPGANLQPERMARFDGSSSVQVIKDFVETERRNKKGKTELRLQGLTGHEAAEKVASALPPSSALPAGHWAIWAVLGHLSSFLLFLAHVHARIPYYTSTHLHRHIRLMFATLGPEPVKVWYRSKMPCRALPAR